MSHRIFLVTIVMTSSCAIALRKNVMNIAVVRDRPYDARVEAYTCRKRKVCTGLFHLRENSSQEVEFHLYIMTM